MSKRLKKYYDSESIKEGRHLSEKTVTVMREAHALFKTGRLKGFEQALLITLGKSTAPMPPDSVLAVEKRLTCIEETLAVILARFDRLLQIDERAEAVQLISGSNGFSAIGNMDIESAFDSLLPGMPDSTATRASSASGIPGTQPVSGSAGQTSGAIVPTSAEGVPGQPTLLDWTEE